MFTEDGVAIRDTNNLFICSVFFLFFAAFMNPIEPSSLREFLSVFESESLSSYVYSSKVASIYESDFGIVTSSGYEETERFLIIRPSEFFNTAFVSLCSISGATYTVTFS